MMLRNAICISLIFFIQSILGCKAAEYKDISYNQDFADFLGKEYQALIDLRLEGLDTGKGGEIDSFLITKKPIVEHLGPEVISSSTLSSGAIFKVINVVKCSNCFLSPHVMIEVKILKSNLVKHPVYFPAHQFQELVAERSIVIKRDSKNSGNGSLNSINSEIPQTLASLPSPDSFRAN